MLSPYFKENIEMLSAFKPSLNIETKDNDQWSSISVTLYIELPEIDRPKFDNLTHEVIATVSAYSCKKNHCGENQLFKVTGTSGSYPGMGGFIYDCLMHSIKDSFGQNSFLISDRESITGEAERLYEKMNSDDCYKKFEIPVMHPLYSKEIEADCFDIYAEKLGLDPDLEYGDYLAKLSNGLAPHTYINKGYMINEVGSFRSIFNILKKQDIQNSLSAEQKKNLLEQSENLGQFMLSNFDEYRDLVKDGFPCFTKPSEPIGSLDFS
ncbi:hypothetical protein [Vibrio owensii]|uniref:hypothetical protein n=1 Tax=Vibrio owensii TaxID=696485 RepID=UPI003CC59C01